MAHVVQLDVEGEGQIEHAPQRLDAGDHGGDRIGHRDLTRQDARQFLVDRHDLRRGEHTELDLALGAFGHLLGEPFHVAVVLRGDRIGMDEPQLLRQRGKRQRAGRQHTQDGALERRGE